jgi:hypothetical protein
VTFAGHDSQVNVSAPVSLQFMFAHPSAARGWKFRLDDEICTFLGYYATSNGNPLPTFRGNVPVFLGLLDP